MKPEITRFNVQMLWELYEEHLKEIKEENNKNLRFCDFKHWVEEELYECPNCSEIVFKDDLRHSADNTDDVCDECITNGYYGRCL